MMKQFYTYLFFGMILLVACREDEEQVALRSEPVILLENEEEEISVPQGNKFEVAFDLSGQAGLASLTVSKNGEIFDEEAFISGRVQTTYVLADRIDPALSPDEIISYQLTLTDRQDRVVERNLNVVVVQSKPLIEVVDDQSTPVVSAGESTQVTLVLNAGTGIQDLTVFKEGVPLEGVTAPEGEEQAVFTFSDSIESETTLNGTVIQYDFVLADALGNTDTLQFPVTFLKTLFSLREVDTLGTRLVVVSGDINLDTAFTADKQYLLDGLIKVVDNSTLSIEAGTTIYGTPTPSDGSENSGLSVTPGARLLAEGSATEPIVFTSVNEINGIPGAGDWSGLLLNGNATVNGMDTRLTALAGSYGGQDDGDDSGILRYVVVAYAGKSLDGRGGGISFNGVGSGTLIEYIQAYQCDNDGVRFRGGKAQVRYLVSESNDSRGVRVQDGWRGFGQFWVMYMNNRSGSSSAITVRNSDDVFGSSDPLLEPRTNPVISNVTLVHDMSGSVIGLRFRRQGIGQVYNGISTGFSNDGGVEFDNNLEDEITDGLTSVQSFHAFDNTESGESSNFGGPSEIFFNNPAYLCSETPVTLAGYVGTVGENASDPQSVDAWFAPATFIGAVESANDWTADWTR